MVLHEVFIMGGYLDLFFLVEYMDEIEFLGDLLMFFLFAEKKHGGLIYFSVLIMSLVSDSA
jgi:hypothetical protein